MTRRTCVIINPESGRGTGRKMSPSIRAAFARHGVSDFFETAVRGDEAILVRRAISEGFSTIVAAGGDGTWSNTARAILREGAGKDVTLALIAAGTGNDLAKSVGAPAHDFAATARMAADEKAAWIDAGRIGDDFFVNSVGFGFDASVLAQIEKLSWLKGSAVYTVAALRQLFTYRGIAVTCDECAIPPRPMMLIVANGGFLGGAFHIAPSASIVDGLLNTVVIGDMGALDRLKLFAAAMKGSHVRHPSVSEMTSRSITLRFESPPQCQRDGELDQLLVRDVTLGCEPKALRIVAEPVAMNRDERGRSQ